MSSGITNADVEARVKRAAEVTGFKLRVEWEPRDGGHMPVIAKLVEGEWLSIVEPMSREKTVLWLNAYVRGFRAGMNVERRRQINVQNVSENGGAQ